MNHPNLVLIVDTSFSVFNYVQSYTNAINGIIEAQKNINPDTLFTCVTFNDNFDYIYLSKSIRDVRPVEITPAGTTALYDCVSAVLRHLTDFFANNSHTVPMIILLTDGEDNNSKILSELEFGLQIEIMKQYGCNLVFLGTTLRSMELGRKAGFNTCVLYDKSSQSIGNIPRLMEEIFKDKITGDNDIDIRVLTEGMNNIKLN